MTVLIIILFVLLLIFFLTLFPFYVNLIYINELSITVKYMFFEFKVYPTDEYKKKKIKKKKKSDKPKKKKPETKHKKKNYTLKQLKDAISKTGLDGFLEIIKSVIIIIKDFYFDIFHHIVIDKFNINITIAGEDASECAINYGYVCSVVYPISGLILKGAKDYNELDLNIIPDFNAKESNVNAQISIYIPIIWGIVMTIKLAIKILFNLIKFKLSTQDNN